MSASTNSQEILEQGLQCVDKPSTRAVLKNPDLFAYVLSIFNTAIKLASGKPAEMAVGVANKTLATGKLVGKASGNQDLLIGVGAAQILLISANLITLNGSGPGAAMATLGSVFAKHTALALGLAGSDDKKAKCIAAIADLAAAGLTTGVIWSKETNGINNAALAGSVAQLILSGYQVYQTYKSK